MRTFKHAYNIYIHMCVYIYIYTYIFKYLQYLQYLNTNKLKMSILVQILIFYYT